MVNRKMLLGAVAVAVGLAAGWVLSGGGGGGIPLPLRRAPPPLPDPLPRIDLDRIAQAGETPELGERDLFAFGPERVQPTPVPVSTPPPVVAGPVATPPPRIQTPASQAGLPSLQVSYIGAVEGPRGLRVAVLLADGREVLTGREGDLVANRLEIVKIGLESVDVKDVGSDRVRRLPLEGAK